LNATDTELDKIKLILDHARRMSYSNLSEHKSAKSDKPYLQNFEPRRTLRTIRVVNHGLGLNAADLPTLHLDVRAILVAIISQVELMRQGANRYDIELLKQLLDAISAPLLPYQPAEKSSTSLNASSELIDYWLRAETALFDPALRAERALSPEIPSKVCPLQNYLWYVIHTDETDNQAKFRAYRVLLALRDGITLSDEVLQEAISMLPNDLLSLEYFCVRYRTRSDESIDGRPVYVGVSYVGGDPRSVRLKHCLMDRQENDREIADMRGHFTGINEVEKRALGMAAVINLAFIADGDPPEHCDFVTRKSLRVASSIVSGLVHKQIDIKRIFVRAVGDIHRVPFEVLPVFYGEQLLGELFALNYLASPTIVQPLTKAHVVCTGQALIVSGCDFDQSQNEGQLLLLRDHSGLFEFLPGTIAEGEMVAKKLEAELLTGELADRPTVSAKLSSPRAVLHFATHSFFVDRERYHAREVGGQVVRTVDPKFAGCIYSGILLSGANDHVGFDGRLWLNDRGILDTSHILQLDLCKTGLVTLSSCDSGIGAMEVGDELDSLRESFLAAGATQVVASLWPVDDVDTTEFMNVFYKYLLEGKYVSEALQYTRIELKHLPVASKCAFVAFGQDMRFDLPETI
jgi:CHAT domain-containing protein